MTVGIILFLITIVAVLYFSGFLTFFRRTYRATKALKQFPIEKHHWLYGHLAVHPGANHEGMLKNIEWTCKNPRYYACYVGPWRPVLVLNHPETVKHVLRTTEPKALFGGSGYTLLRPWLGNGLLLSSGDKWFRNRKLLTPGFHFNVLKPYINIHNNCVEKLMDKLSAETHKSLDIFKLVSLCTLDNILRCAFSTDRDVQSDGDSEPYVQAITEITRLIVDRALKPYLHFDWLYYLTNNGKRFKELCDFFHQDALKVMRERQAELKSSPTRNRGKYVDFLDILLLARDETGNGLTQKEIQDEVVTFMFEGHDTTASGISWIMYNLAKHPDIQSKARQEVDSVLRERDNDVIEWTDLSKFAYLTMCIKESLRLYPPVPIISRQTTKPLHIDGKVVPPYTRVNINIWNLHHNPTVWSDAMTYNPDRFLPENIAKMDSHSMILFSAGPRNCIGQHFAMNELKVTVARILRNFEFTLDSSQAVRLVPDVVLRAESGIHLVFKQRDI